MPMTAKLPRGHSPTAQPALLLPVRPPKLRTRMDDRIAIFQPNPTTYPIPALPHRNPAPFLLLILPSNTISASLFSYGPQPPSPSRISRPLRTLTSFQTTLATRISLPSPLAAIPRPPCRLSPKLKPCRRSGQSLPTPTASYLRNSMQRTFGQSAITPWAA
jgi:hypothetical protein